MSTILNFGYNFFFGLSFPIFFQIFCQYGETAIKTHYLFFFQNMFYTKHKIMVEYQIGSLARMEENRKTAAFILRNAIKEKKLLSTQIHTRITISGTPSVSFYLDIIIYLNKYKIVGGNLGMLQTVNFTAQYGEH
ncbi:hypothetical protein ACJX0J_038624, partial [Zea mays]